MGEEGGGNKGGREGGRETAYISRGALRVYRTVM